MTRSSRRSPDRGPVSTALAVCALALLGLASISSARAQSSAEVVRRGEGLYRIHCVNCHGEQARGDGPMAPVLKTEVPDLTLLAARNDGELPRERVHQSIDGRIRVRGHGLREMPVWGLSFQERGADSDQELEVQERLRALVAYLESIQRPE